MPCCEYGDSLGTQSETSLEEIWNGDATQELRRQFLAGDKPTGCWKCFDRDANEGSSLRQVSNKEFPGWVQRVCESDDRLNSAPASPSTLDLRFSNLCNFKCRSCWHGSSSKWFSDAKAIGVTAGPKAEIRSFENADAVERQFEPYLDKLDDIYFAGGEPSMMIEHYRLLKLLLKHRRTDVRIRYTINMSMKQFDGESLFDLWRQFDNIKIQASLDATGARGELMRHGFDWDSYVMNVLELRDQCPHVQLTFGTTVSAFNILTLPDLCEAVRETFDMAPSKIDLHSLQEPGFYSSQILPRSLKKTASRQIDDYLRKLRSENALKSEDLNATHKGLTAVKDYMNAKDQQWAIPQFRALTQKLDALRMENTQDVFPELDEIWTYQHTLWNRASNKLRAALRNR